MGRLFPIALLLPSIRTPCLREAICSMGNLMAVCIVWGLDLYFMEVKWRMVKKLSNGHASHRMAPCTGKKCTLNWLA